MPWWEGSSPSAAPPSPSAAPPSPSAPPPQPPPPPFAAVFHEKLVSDLFSSSPNASSFPSSKAADGWTPRRAKEDRGEEEERSKKNTTEDKGFSFTFQTMKEELEEAKEEGEGAGVYVFKEMKEAARVVQESQRRRGTVRTRFVRRGRSSSRSPGKAKAGLTSSFNLDYSFRTGTKSGDVATQSPPFVGESTPPPPPMEKEERFVFGNAEDAATPCDSFSSMDIDSFESPAPTTTPVTATSDPRKREEAGQEANEESPPVARNHQFHFSFRSTASPEVQGGGGRVKVRPKARRKKAGNMADITRRAAAMKVDDEMSKKEEKGEPEAKSPPDTFPDFGSRKDGADVQRSSMKSEAFFKAGGKQREASENVFPEGKAEGGRSGSGGGSQRTGSAFTKFVNHNTSDRNGCHFGNQTSPAFEMKGEGGNNSFPFFKKPFVFGRDEEGIDGQPHQSFATKNNSTTQQPRDSTTPRRIFKVPKQKRSDFANESSLLNAETQMRLGKLEEARAAFAKILLGLAPGDVRRQRAEVGLEKVNALERLGRSGARESSTSGRHHNNNATSRNKSSGSGGRERSSSGGPGPSSSSQTARGYETMTKKDDRKKKEDKEESRRTSASKGGGVKEVVSALKDRGNLLFKQKKFLEAYGEYSKAIESCPAADTDLNKYRAILYSNRAAALHKLSRYTECVRDCFISLDQDPTFLKCLWRRSEAYRTLGYCEGLKSDLAQLASLGDPKARGELRKVERREETIKIDHFKVLGVERTDSAKEIKDAFRNLALKFHPDKAKSDSERKAADVLFKIVSDAFRILGSQEERAKYERSFFNIYSAQRSPEPRSSGQWHRRRDFYGY